MKQKRWISYLAAAVTAIVIALITIYFESSTYGTDGVLLIQFCSDGFFTSAVMFLGCGILMAIEETGNFYGIRYLGYTVVYLFSFRKERFENRKDYFTYCLEKKAKQKDKDRPGTKRVLLSIGGVCLIVSVVCAALSMKNR